MYVVKTNIKGALSKPTEEDLAKAFGMAVRYIQVANKCVDLCDRWEELTATSEGEDKLTEDLKEFINLPIPVLLGNMIDKRVFFGDLPERQYIEFLGTLESIKYTEADLIGNDLPLSGEDDEYSEFSAKLVKVAGQMSVIAMNVIRGTEILDSKEIGGDMKVPKALDIFLASKGAYSEETIIDLIHMFQASVEKAGIVLEVFDGYEGLRDEFYGALPDEYIPVFEAFEQYLNIEDVQSYVDETISEGELLETIGLSEDDIKLNIEE